MVGRLPEDGPEWGADAPRFEGPVSVEGRAQALTEDDVLVRVTVEGAVVGECSRCLAPVQDRFRYSFDLYFSSVADEDDGEVRPLPPEAVSLDLAAPLREELLLALPTYRLCREDCAGLCPSCGANRNESPCGCSTEEIDPRWAALRTLNE